MNVVDSQDVVKEFQGDYRFLSNFWFVDIEFDGEIYRTVEHAYQAAKTLDLREREQIRISPTPGSAKRRGRYVKMRKDWDNIKIDIMLSLLRKKFQDECLKKKLLATGNRILQEGNMWGDILWGVDLKSGKGKNMLGKLIMNVRKEIQDDEKANQASSIIR